MINTKEPKELNNTGEMVGEIFQEFNDMTLLELQAYLSSFKEGY